MDACIPHKMTSPRYNLSWFNSSLRRQSRAKQGLSDSETKSDLLNKQFSNIYTKEDLASIPAVDHSPKPTIGSLIVTLPGVIKHWSQTKQVDLIRFPRGF